MRSLAALGLLFFFACGGNDASDGPNGGGPNGSSSGSSGAGGDGGGGSGGEGGADPNYTPTYGRFGTPTVTFTLPAPNAAGELYHPDVQDSFKDVDWQNLERLYIPAREYKSLLLGNLPKRSADKPLVITNIGGQVKVGGKGANYIFNLAGGSNWILTGRHDPTSKTGDPGFRGHLEGAYAHSQGTYGILVDDNFSKEGLSGIAIGNYATDFELEALEVTRAEFAGITAKTDGKGDATMKNVKLHDVYIHDVGSEGIYFGSTQPQPQHTFENLHVHDNRILRTGTEALQVGQLGPGCEIDHNVLGPGAVRWRSAFQQYQDGNVQYGQRHGSSSFHHNVVIGGASMLTQFFPQHVASDPHAATDTVTFSDNYYADSSSSGAYTHADENSVTVKFERNTFRGFVFDYDQVYPASKVPVGVFAIGANTKNKHVLADNIVDGPYRFLAYDQPIATVTNNTTATIARIQFRDFMGAAIDENYRKIEWWTPTMTRAPGNPPMTYKTGSFVVHGGTIYEALGESTNREPDKDAAKWKPLAAPADDVRTAAGSPHADRGVRWPPAN